MKEEDILAALYVNTNQTQAVYAQGSNLTWTKTGSVQVSVIGEDEKWAFTAVVSAVFCSCSKPYTWRNQIGPALTSQ
jgi:hypothetical protein